MNLPEKISAKDVEVCVLTFNRCALLKQALESLAGQTADGFLVSVYDNASSDATPEVVEAAKKSVGENLKYVRHSENIGADANFHAALDGASRKYTMFMHDDDIANPNYLEYAIEAINIFGNVALLASDYTCIKLPPNSPAQFNHTLPLPFANPSLTHPKRKENTTHALSSQHFTTPLNSKESTAMHLYNLTIHKPSVVQRSIYGWCRLG